MNNKNDSDLSLDLLAKDAPLINLVESIKTITEGKFIALPLSKQFIDFANTSLGLVI